MRKEFPCHDVIMGKQRKIQTAHKLYKLGAIPKGLSNIIRAPMERPNTPNTLSVIMRKFRE